MARRDVHPEDDMALRKAARQVLDSNRIDGKASTIPAPGQYPHQWNWDSAFIAIGLACIDVDRAQAEIEALLGGQWANGMVPQIIYNPDRNSDKAYWPNRERWGIKENVDQNQGPQEGVDTSGITQPPVVAIAVEYIHKKSTDKEMSRNFLRRVYPKLLKYHSFLLSERDPEKEGLVFLVHPWESGLDDSPRWHSAIEAIDVNPDTLPAYERLDLKLVASEQRPTKEHYDRYQQLIEVYRAYRYDQYRLFEHCPFRVQDVLFTSILHRANRALLGIARELGEPTDIIEVWMDYTQASFNNKLWSPLHGLYLDFDLRTSKLILQNTIATFIPLFAGLASAEQAHRLIAEHLKNPKEYWSSDNDPHFVVPTVSKSNSLWSPNRYWCGPVWVNTNWMVIKGLEDYGYFEEAQRIRQDTLSLMRNPIPDAGEWRFWEYFNPHSGNVLGIDRFSWSAALSIELTEI